MSKINFLHSVIFLGTGASSSLPNVLCITREKSGCKVCPSALTEEGKRNRRRNCSLLVRWYDGEGKLRNILIDCGKTFFEASLAFLAPLKITTIDAVILTHGHADAMFGLDDLRSWSWMKEGGIPVYLSQSTMDVVSSAFPYLVDRNKATGGGEVPTLRFKVINEYKNFTVEGLEFTPINVEHGVQHGCQAYMSLGFRFKNVTYLSDVSKIPDEVRNRLDGTKLLIIDCLRELYYPSHYGFQEAIGEVIRYKPLNTYFIGMGHSLDHEEFNKKCHKVSAAKFPGHSMQPAYDGLTLEFSDSTQKEFNLSSLN